MNWQDLKHERTDDLIDYIKYKEQADYRELAEAAFAAFTFRFNKEIVDKCRKVGKKWGYDNDAADLISERTFERFWSYPFGFDKNKCGDLIIDNCVRLYLFKIARNCFFDYSKEILCEGTPYDGTENVIVEFPYTDNLEMAEVNAKDLQKIHDIIESALAKLSPKHKTIYLTYKMHEKEGYKLPRKLLKQLREELQLSQDSIRVYKKEAFETVDQYLKLYGNK